MELTSAEVNLLIKIMETNEQDTRNRHGALRTRAELMTKLYAEHDRFKAERAAEGVGEDD